MKKVTISVLENLKNSLIQAQRITQHAQKVQHRHVLASNDVINCVHVALQKAKRREDYLKKELKNKLLHFFMQDLLKTKEECKDSTRFCCKHGDGCSAACDYADW